jgi:2-dehydropantoate 2-reductase
VKGRRTEIDFLNGLVVEKGVLAGVPAPTHAAMVEVVHLVERGEFEPAPRLADEIWRLAGTRPS